MHHPGPPRFIHVGESVELAPRDPDLAARYDWSIVERPRDSTVSLSDEPVQWFSPSVPGRYRLCLSAPDGDHFLSIRVFPEQYGESVTDAKGHSGGIDTSEFLRTSVGIGASGDQAPTTEGTAATGRPRLQLQGRVEGSDIVISPTVEPHPDDQGQSLSFDVEYLIDDRDPLEAEAVDREGTDLRIPMGALTGQTRIYAVALTGDSYSVPDMIECLPSDVDGGASSESEDAVDSVAINRPYDPPSWAEDAVIYEIYVRTFGNAGHESVFNAIQDKLDYLDDLGVDVLWLTPVLQNDHAPHGYNITDFFAIAEDLGTREDYEQFIAAAHDRGMKVLFDLVCNHSARTHPFFQKAITDADSPYREWYEWRDYEAREPATYFEWEHIANFNFRHLPVRRHLLDVIAEWAPLVDGFRCDMAWAVPTNFWRELHDTMRARDESFLLLDETIPYIPDYQAGLFDMHFDSTTYFTLRQVGLGQAPASSIVDSIADRVESSFPPHAAFMVYSENHDEGRYLVECGSSAAKAAAGAICTLPGAPMIYAGQEFGQLGRRDRLVWEEAREDLQSLYRALIDCRHGREALSHHAGFYELDYTVNAGDPARVVAYGRAMDDDRLSVVLNFGQEPATVVLPEKVGHTDLVRGQSVAHNGAIRVDDVVILEGMAQESPIGS